MKKTLFVIVILCLFAAPAIFAQSNLGAFQLVMNDNFEWGTGYYGLINGAELMNGHRIRRGETYNLKATFTISRDLEGPLWIHFLDWTDRARPSWWGILSLEADPQIVDLGTLKAGQTYSIDMTIRTTADASSNARNANSIVFMASGGRGTTGRAGSGALGPVTVSFTEFVLTRQ